MRNRLIKRYYEAADHVFLNGSTPWEVDEAMVALGFAFGPFEAEDRVGLDASGATARRGPLVGRMLGLGKLGRKTGAGWYRYPGGGGKVEDPIVADLALEEAHFGGFSRTEYSSTEIQDRLLFALIVEASALLAAGAGASDIASACRQALGFPDTLTDPVHLAEDLGRDKVIARLRELAVEDPAIWSVTDRLQAWADRKTPLREA